LPERKRSIGRLWRVFNRFFQDVLGANRILASQLHSRQGNSRLQVGWKFLKYILQALDRIVWSTQLIVCNRERIDRFRVVGGRKKHLL
jgi:hypothetical protein